MFADEGKTHAVVMVLGLDGEGKKSVSLNLSGLEEGVEYSLAEINCDKPHPAKFSGRSLELELDGPFDSAVFELRTK